MEVLINNELSDQDLTPYAELIRQSFNIAAHLEDIKVPSQVGVSFVDNAEIRKLNWRYRRINSPTDVLSFPQDDEFGLLPGMPNFLGDIVISLEQASEQAGEYNHSIEREVVFLAVHGFFHLLGYDHENPEEEAIMRQKEERVLKELGLGRD